MRDKFGIAYATGSAPAWPLEVSGKRTVTIDFGDPRPHGSSTPTRHHAGEDLPAPRGTLMLAMERGKIVAIDEDWYTNSKGSKTGATYLQTDSGVVINYGETEPGSTRALGLEVGSIVERGKPLGRVGATLQLHLETYTQGTRYSSRWDWQGTPPSRLLDPTKYLQLAAQGGGSTTPPPSGGSDKAKLYAQLRKVSLLTEDQRLFLMLVAYGESRYEPGAKNTSDDALALANAAYDSLVAQDRLDASCGYTRESLTRDGAAGRFGRLVPYYVDDLRDVVPCIKPESINDGLHDIVAAVAQARRLQNYASWNGTIGDLRAGWGRPSWMGGNAPAERIARWAGHADDEGFSGVKGSGGMAFLARPLTPFTSDLRGVLRSLQIAAVS